MYNILCIITYIILHSVNILDKLNAEARACHKRNKKKKKKEKNKKRKHERQYETRCTRSKSRLQQARIRGPARNLLSICTLSVTFSFALGKQLQRRD